MNRALVAWASLLALLAGCPLPQPLPSYPAGTVTPPRILMDPLMGPQSTIRVPAGCSSAPTWDSTPELVDDNTSETVTVRWFVDYDRTSQTLCVPAQEDVLTGPGDQAADPTRRTAPPFHFAPYSRSPVIGGTDPEGPGVVHVVELAVSNRFDASTDNQALCTDAVPGDTFPFRMPASQGGSHFETQTYRWIFVNVSDPGVPCP